MGESLIPIPIENKNADKTMASETPMKKSDGGKIAPTISESAKPENDAKSAADKESLLDEFYQQIKNCTKCPLHRSRNKFVFGAGSADADIMFIGEAPGGDEDRTGIPFVGRAGKLLDRILAAAGLKRREIYIANVLKCRPPKNRDPLPAEEEMCLPYLHRQIEIIQPKIICCLGRVAAHALLHTKANMSDMRGILYKFREIPMIVTYHPAALLRSDKYKRPTWEDFQFMLEELEKIKRSA